MDRRPTGALSPRHDGASRIQKPESKADRMAALKARVAAATASTSASGTNTSTSTSTNMASSTTTPRQTGGLNVGLHPALEDMGAWKSTTANRTNNSRPSATQGASKYTSSFGAPSSKSKAATISSNGANPYLDTGTALPGSKPRQSRQLIFNQKGKYIQQAAALRRQAALEAMKKKIAEQTRKAGIDNDPGEKAFEIKPPPEVEWWDEGLIDSYESLTDDFTTVKLDTADSIVTNLIQHPVPLEPPQDKNIPAPKPMFLTPKEQAKLRRQTRMANLKEQQAKERLGLVPAPPPKIKKSNLMRVLGEEAVKDPTAVEARVNQQIAERLQTHLQTNEDRKLTKEQQHEKLAAQQEKDAAKGLQIMVFKIGSLANGQIRYKIGINAEQMALTGMCIMQPKFSLVIVEGGEHSIKSYKKLMCNRIKWTENTPTREGVKQEQLKEWLVAEDSKGQLKDMGANYCKLIFEGNVKARTFKKFSSRVFETDPEARDFLGKSKMENFWSQANSTV